jgi:uncharacterized membrane protein
LVKLLGIYLAKVAKSFEEDLPMSENKNPLDNLNDLNNTPDITSQYDPQDIESNKIMALLSYIGFLFIVPLLAAKDSKFARFHANQGIVLFIATIVLNIVSVLLGYIPVVGLILLWVMRVIWWVLAVLGIVNAFSGKAKQLPLIGGITILK